MRTKLYMTNTFHSLIRGKLKTANGTYTEGYFIVDTACTNSIVNEMFCSEEFLKKDMTFNLIGAGNESKKAKVYNYTYTVENEEFCDNFQEAGNLDEMIGNNSITILGILGLTFFWKYKMVIDYNVYEIYNLPEDYSINFEDYHFKFPLAYGLETWNLPIVGISNEQNKDLALVMIDTGSNVNIMCKSILEDFKFQHESTNDRNEVTNIYGKEENTVNKVNFNILSINGNDFEYQNKSEYFNISNLEYLLKEGENSVGCILGNQFMFDNKMIIDFKNCAIYSHL